MAFVLLLFFSFPAFSQKVFLKVSIENKISNPANDTIYYSINRLLTWDDFKGVPDYNSPGGAITASGFAFNANMNMIGKDIYLNISVYTFFSKKNSWKKPNINSSYHLVHEQHHFDIARLGSQKLIAELAKAHFTRKNYAALLTSIFDKVYRENQSIQFQYDRQTNHSLDLKKQLEWNDRIDAQIEALKRSIALKH